MAKRPNDTVIEENDELTEVDYTDEDPPDNGQKPETEPQETSRMLVSMVSDPQVQAILAARREGRTVKVVDDVAETPDETPDLITDSDLADLDEDTRRVVGLLQKEIKTQMGPLLEKVASLEEIAAGFQKTQVNTQITEVAAKYPDFNKYRKQMSELARNEGAGLGVEELFLLSKHRAGDLSLTDNSTHSERPTPTPRRKGVGARKQDAPRGRKGFQVSLADALDRVFDS